MKHIVSVVGIRPDFIRMSEVFRRLDDSFEHTLIHTGQHYDYLLSDVFFEELTIRKPDYNLQIGGPGNKHYHQQAQLTVKLVELMEKLPKPDMILFLGDSNSVTAALPLKKEGYQVGHIEAGMRSYDRRMLEEMNRIVCDHCSDHLFVYHENYRTNAIREGIFDDRITVCGNTIVEVVKPLATEMKKHHKRQDRILMDIHRPENFQDPDRLREIFRYADLTRLAFGVPIHCLSFPRTNEYIKKFDIDVKHVEMIPLMSFKAFLQAQYDALFLISDSGTAQEEAALLETPVIVPRTHTERPESLLYNCSTMLSVDDCKQWEDTWNFVKYARFYTQWLGDGNTSYIIRDKLQTL